MDIKLLNNDDVFIKNYCKELLVNWLGVNGIIGLLFYLEEIKLIILILVLLMSTLYLMNRLIKCWGAKDSKKKLSDFMKTSNQNFDLYRNSEDYLNKDESESLDKGVKSLIISGYSNDKIKDYYGELVNDIKINKIRNSLFK